MINATFRHATSLAVFLSALSNLVVGTTSFHHVLTGTGALEVQLIAAKLALKSGDTCSIIISPENKERQRKTCMKLMYGNDVYDSISGSDNERKQYPIPEFVFDSESIGDALSKAESIIICCEEQELDDTYINTILSNSPKLTKFALLSKHGGKFKSMEGSIRAKCQEISSPVSGNQTVAFSIVRAGTLVGGGPGGNVTKQKGEEWGLSKHYYDTKYELSDAMNTMSMDKFTLGAKVSSGDPFKGPNFFSKIVSGNSFEPRDGDTGRIAAAHALLAAVRKGDGVDVSISTTKGEKPLSFEEWDTLLSQY